MQNNKGITLIALVVTIIVLMILTSITTFYGKETINDSKYYNAISQMKIMQSNVNEKYEEYRYIENDSEKEDFKSDYGKDFSSSDNRLTTAISAMNDSINNNSNLIRIKLNQKNNYKYFSVEYITEELDIEGITYDFAIDLDTRNVILLDGIERDGITFYSLCQIEDEQYNVDYEG